MSTGLDYEKAARAASETLVRYGVKTTAVSSIPILEQMGNVAVVSFAEMSKIAGIDQPDLMPMFGKYRTSSLLSIRKEDLGGMSWRITVCCRPP